MARMIVLRRRQICSGWVLHWWRLLRLCRDGINASGARMHGCYETPASPGVRQSPDL